MTTAFEQRLQGAPGHLQEAENDLLSLAPEYGRGGVVHSGDKELYYECFDRSPEVRQAIIALFRARRDFYEAIEHGYARPRGMLKDRAPADTYKWMAQVLDNVLVYMECGSSLPDWKDFDDFFPGWWYS